MSIKVPSKSLHRPVRGSEDGLVVGVDFMGPFEKSVDGHVWLMNGSGHGHP